MQQFKVSAIIDIYNRCACFKTIKACVFFICQMVSSPPHNCWFRLWYVSRDQTSLSPILKHFQGCMQLQRAFDSVLRFKCLFAFKRLLRLFVPTTLETLCSVPSDIVMVLLSLLTFGLTITATSGLFLQGFRTPSHLKAFSTRRKKKQACQLRHMQFSKLKLIMQFAFVTSLPLINDCNFQSGVGSGRRKSCMLESIVLQCIFLRPAHDLLTIPIAFRALTW